MSKKAMSLKAQKYKSYFDNILNRVKVIETSEVLRERWNKYSKNYPYAEDITWGNCIIKFLKLNKKGYEVLAH